MKHRKAKADGVLLPQRLETSLERSEARKPTKIKQRRCVKVENERDLCCFGTTDLFRNANGHPVEPD
jgi:hypothetical protein